MEIIRRTPINQGAGDGISRRTSRTNLCTNSEGATNTDDWTSFEGVTLSVEAADAPLSATTFKATIGAAIASQNLAFIPTVGTLTAGTPYTATLYFKGEGTAIGKSANILIWETGGAQASATIATTSVVLDGSWQKVVASGTLAQGDRTAVQTYSRLVSAADGDVLYFTSVQTEDRKIGTPYIPTDGAAVTRYSHRRMITI